MEAKFQIKACEVRSQSECQFVTRFSLFCGLNGSKMVQINLNNVEACSQHPEFEKNKKVDVVSTGKWGQVFQCFSVTWPQMEIYM